jgi:oxidoreductase
VTPRDSPILLRHGIDLNKLTQKEVDFENLAASGMKEGKWDVVYIAYVLRMLEVDLRSWTNAVTRLGTTRAQAGSAEAFVKIDREYVVTAAKEAKSDDPSFKQRVVYVSVCAQGRILPLYRS